MLKAPTNFRRIGAVLGLAALLTAAGASVAVAPAAAAKKHNISRPYVKNWVFRSTKLNRCVFIEVQGSVVGTWEYLYGDSGGDKDSLWWTKLKLKSKKTLNQFNSGYPIKFANTAASVRAGGVAFSGVITVRAHTKSSSDAVRHTLNVVLNK